MSKERSMNAERGGLSLAGAQAPAMVGVAVAGVGVGHMGAGFKGFNDATRMFAKGEGTGYSGAKVPKSKVEDLLSGKDVEVGSIKEADELLKQALPNAKKVSGAGPSKPDFSKFKGKDTNGMYHKDYLENPLTGRIFGHDNTNPHGYFKHINIKLPDGNKVTIKITPN